MTSNSTFFFFVESRSIQAEHKTVAAVDNFLWRVGSGDISAESVSEKFTNGLPLAISILDQYCSAGLLSKRRVRPCPNEDCNVGLIWEEDFENEACSSCGCELTKDWRQSSTTTRYLINRKGRHFSPWLLLLHGMNTPGEWQQEVVYKFGLQSENSPFKIYKYGIRRIEPFFTLLQNCRTNDFRRDYYRAAAEAKKNGILDPPDVIAHSFGTLIIGRAMEKDKNIVFGKVILCGSILRPDFNWAKHVREGRVTLVLNHFGGKDFWAHIAVYAIPNSGPSGRIGFVETDQVKNQVFNVRSEHYEHSDFFKDENFLIQFKRLWRPFLWGRLDDLRGVINLHEGLAQWNQPFFILRGAISNMILLLIFSALAYLFLQLVF
jgi:pimeloyl-ACP methyl ester carboxylesterase